jgi:hypothetical protein
MGAGVSDAHGGLAGGHVEGAHERVLFGCPPGFLGQGTVQGGEGLGHALDEYGWVDEPVGHDLEDLSGQIGGTCAPWFLFINPALKLTATKSLKDLCIQRITWATGWKEVPLLKGRVNSVQDAG